MTMHEDGDIPDEWRKTITVPLQDNMGSRNECNNYRGQVYLLLQEKNMDVLTKRMMEITERKVSER